MKKAGRLRERLERVTSLSVQSIQSLNKPDAYGMKENVTVDMGWGRIIFGQTFKSMQVLFDAICREKTNSRDILFYLRDPHVLLSMGPDKLFLDPSHTYRIWPYAYTKANGRAQAFTVRRISTLEDAEGMNRIYRSRKMVPCNPEFLLNQHTSRLRTYLVAELLPGQEIIGTVTGVDHAVAFNDSENGASLWSLAVDPQTPLPGVGEALVRHLVEHFFTRGRNYVDLSVMHNNHEAILLYEKMGFQRVPVFCVKRKNAINESLFMAEPPIDDLNPYARIIINEARRRGIEVDILDAESSFFKMKWGGRSIVCRESLSDLTSAVAMSRCDDKRLTNRLLKKGELSVPAQFTAGNTAHNTSILKQLKRVVVKPERGEQGHGISVDIQTEKELTKAIDTAKHFCKTVLIEQFVPGEDIRIVVIDYQVVAAAVRKPPVITGTGRHSVEALIGKYNRRRLAATGGESRVPLDRETKRCVAAEGFALDTILPEGEGLCIRKTANLHTGGTICDVTEKLHPELIQAAEKAARLIQIPVTGLDFIVPDIAGASYHIIEANERPGLANHEPQPTAERFIDFLFPQISSTLS